MFALTGSMVRFAPCPIFAARFSIRPTRSAGHVNSAVLIKARTLAASSTVFTCLFRAMTMATRDRKVLRRLESLGARGYLQDNLAPQHMRQLCKRPVRDAVRQQSVF